MGPEILLAATQQASISGDCSNDSLGALGITEAHPQGYIHLSWYLNLAFVACSEIDVVVIAYWLVL